ncbi:hypothetical protein [Paenibacillus beijingensis]|uniref:Uncharacterized protein n=1 Tax=Paenibacillus beijingensis TaxID=1126833 RepID=A0A0D5NQQ8_9BACL|nr:hypothetical protein [Paenibacillus beijingensis]AJY77248.1 hypothetical protein VN24_25200 [Paenibacillus beijingensis]
MDGLVMIAASVLVLYWIYRALYHWLHEPRAVNRLILGSGEPLEPDDEAVLLLESCGYAVSSGKHRLPIELELDGKPLQSRIYVDYIAEKDGLMYAVKMARERQPMNWTGSGLRDRLLVYSLLLPQMEGILVVDMRDGSVRMVKFLLDNQ